MLSNFDFVEEFKPYFNASLLREVAPPIVFKAVTEGVTS